MNRKKPVQFSEEKDISLLRHVLGENLFEQSKRWADIAKAMTDDSFVVDARRVREKTQLLISKFKRKDAKNIRKSGEEEDLTEKTVLLQEYLDLQREAETVLQKERDAKEDQKSKDEETGKNIRKRALEDLMKKTKIQRYMNWVRAGLALHVVKMELDKICDEAVATQHKELIENVKRRKGLSTVLCNKCNLKTLLPDHVQTEHKQCPLGYLNCNCLNPDEKLACPNRVCGALYDDIIRLCKSTPPTPFWENTNVQMWCTDPWSIAKCFISKSGYATKTKASEFDIKEIFLLWKNNKELPRSRKGKIYIPNLSVLLFPEVDEDKLSQVCRHRDSLYYSEEMEIDWLSANVYTDAFRNVLFPTPPSWIHESKFPRYDFIVTTTHEDLVHSDVIAALSEEVKYLVQKITSCQETNLLSEKGIKDEEVHVKKRYAIKMPTVPEARQEPTTSNQMDHLAEDVFETRLEKFETLISFHREKMDYIQNKIDLQIWLVKNYQDQVVKVPALPIQPEQNQRNIDDVYVGPWMTVLDEDDPNKKACELRENKIMSLFEVFKESGDTIKDVYVLGEAGTGKSIFCKSLVQKWCKMHMESDKGGRLYLSKEMKIIQRFEFLFFILLRHHLDKPTIKMMLEVQFGHPALQKILDTESDRCLIVLDGLDEWIPKSLSHSQTENKGLPVRDKAKDYTVVTTSRPWTVELLAMKRNEILKKVMLRGISKNATKALVKKTIKLLNATFEQNRSSEAFIKYLKTRPFSEIQHIPLLLQKLICLWYENNDLTSSSRCTLYSGMLELPFKWLDQKKRENYESGLGSKTKSLPSLQIPHALDPARMYPDYQNTINSASKLAFEVLFKQHKENTISFDIQTCKRLQIPVDVLKVCVNNGILCEDKNVGFTAVGQNELSFSFVHKSIQEFLAAVHIADILKTRSLPVSEREETTSSHPMTEQEEYTTTLRQLSELDDTTYLRHVSEKDIAPRHHVPELDDTTYLRHVSEKDIAPRHHVPELDDSTNLRHVSEKDIAPRHHVPEPDDTTNLLHVSEKDIALRHHVPELDDITIQHPRSEWGNMASPQSSSLSENITSLHTSSGKDYLMSPQTVSEREHITSPHSSSQFEDVWSPNIGSVPENITSPHQSSLTPSCTHSERDDTTCPYHRLEREDMSEREYAKWPDVCEDFIRKIFARIETIENILEVSDVFVFLSGLEPRLATYISKYIYNIVNRSSLVVQHRNTLDECTFLYDIQKCISGCCDEANSNAMYALCAVYLGDCFLDDSESVMPGLNSSMAQNIIPCSIESLSVSFSRECPLFRGCYKCEICSVLTRLSSCRRLTKLVLKDKRRKRDDLHIRLIQEILETNVHSLRTVSVNYSFGVKSCLKGMKSFEPLIISIPKLNQLTSLKLLGLNLRHQQCNFLGSYLADTVRLQELSLDIECEGKDDHETDMSTHDTLQYLEIGDGFTVKNVNTKHDMTVKFKLKQSDNSSVDRQFRILESVKLKNVSLWGNRDSDSVSAVVTHNLCSLLTKSTDLHAIELDNLNITDNILTLPERLVSLKRIDLSVVTMTKKTWKTFIDSLPSIPNVVHVKTLGLVIKDIICLPIRFEPLYKRDLIKLREALYYVKCQGKLFHITRDDDNLFEFSTHKNGD